MRLVKILMDLFAGKDSLQYFLKKKLTLKKMKTETFYARLNLTIPAAKLQRT